MNLSSFAEFLQAYATGEIKKDVTWRAYLIEKHWSAIHVKHALKRLGYAHCGELGLGECAAQFGLTPAMAGEALGCWWVWSQIDQGRHLRVPKRAGPSLVTGEIVSPAQRALFGAGDPS